MNKMKNSTFIGLIISITFIVLSYKQIDNNDKGTVAYTLFIITLIFFSIAFVVLSYQTIKNIIKKE